MILKAWERCRFSRPHMKAPYGCFTVHVGAERERFFVKTKYVNHPLFQILLEEAEQEYGFESDGPIWLPCNVDLFYKVLAEMDNNTNKIIFHGSHRRSFIAMAKVFSSFLLRIPPRLLCDHMNKGHGAYSLIDSELLKINRFH